MQPRLTRLRTDRVLAGVCSGLGQYFAVDPVIVRLIFVVLTITTGGLLLLLYPVLWLIMPEANTPSIPLPPDARFDPMTGQPLQPPTPQGMTGQTVSLQSAVPTPVPAASGNRNRILGMLLIGVGGIALLDTVGDSLARLFNINLGSLIVPALLVGLGLYLLRNKTT